MPPGCILISDLVVANLFIHSLPGMILSYLLALLYTEGVVAYDIITFVRFMHCYRSRIINSHTATPAEVDQKIYISVNVLSYTDNTTCTEHLIESKTSSKSIILKFIIIGK